MSKRPISHLEVAVIALLVISILAVIAKCFPDLRRQKGLGLLGSMTMTMNVGSTTMLKQVNS